VPLFAAHVMMFAGYLVSLARRLEGRAPSSVRVEWRDPAQEIRHGERKSFDARVPLYVDCLPHVVSVLTLLWPQARVSGRSLRLERGGARVMMELRIGDADCHVLLERNAPERVRRLSVSAGPRTELDFTREPGDLRLDGVPYDACPEWQSSPRPLAAMLAAFAESLGGSAPDARLDADVAVRAAELIGWAAPIYNSQRLRWFEGARFTRPAGDAELQYALAELPSLADASDPDSMIDVSGHRPH
jgi:hypothetical protein